MCRSFKIHALKFAIALLLIQPQKYEKAANMRHTLSLPVYENKSKELIYGKTLPQMNFMPLTPQADILSNLRPFYEP